MDKLYHYYKEKEILPTYARLERFEDLAKYEAGRTAFFCDKLKLPPQMFDQKQLIEFGPDSGENALVFARWGASLTLVEPNSACKNYIDTYFQKFNLKPHLNTLIESNIETFQPRSLYDFAIAEGFIQTVKPESIWINQFKQCLKDRGFFVISYYDSTGAVLELFLKVIFMRACAVSPSVDRLDIAVQLFQSKWDSIPHTRSFQSWVMDVLENPFTRLAFFIDGAQLYEMLINEGFSNYSSWPAYQDGSDIYWHKKYLTETEKLSKNRHYLARSCLSFLFGKKMFLCSPGDQAPLDAWQNVKTLIASLDRLVDSFDVITVQSCKDSLNNIKRILLNQPLLTHSSNTLQESLNLINSMETILDLLFKGDIPGLVSFCNSDKTFIEFWGIPCHYAVYYKNQNHNPRIEKNK